MIPDALLKLPALKEFAWWCLAAQICPQVDLWAVKDGQINTPSILDRTRGPETSWYLRSSRMQHTIFVSSRPFPVGFGEGKWEETPHTLLPADSTKGRHEIPDDVIRHVASNGSISQFKGLNWSDNCLWPPVEREMIFSLCGINA